MKKHTIILFIFLNICIGLISCSSIDSSSNTKNNQESSTNSESSDNTENNINNYASLKIVCDYSGTNDNIGYISRVGIVGYSFDDLRILYTESKTFDLLNGIPGGYENVNINVTFYPAKKVGMGTINYTSVKCNFVEGKTTTVVLNQDLTLTVSY